jgi:release factor glutamine methyltransferase
MQIAKALKQAKHQLSNSDSANLDAEVLLCSLLNCERTYLYSHPEKELAEDDYAAFNRLIESRATGHPVAHLTKNKEFWSLDFMVTPDTLIPRPETEVLVETALTLIPSDSHVSVLDLGTGTGAIAIAIASERPNADITATDISSDALMIAIKNAAAHCVKHIIFKHGNWFEIDELETYDLILSNPPYIRTNDPHLSQGDVRFESKKALVSGEDGLHDLRIIIKEAKLHLKNNGWLLVEHGYDQGNEVRQLFLDYDYTRVSTIQDYDGNDRVTIGSQINHDG